MKSFDNHEKNDIIYLSSSTFFDNSANSVHVAKMSNAFAQIGYKTILYTYQHHQPERGAHKEYGVSHDLEFNYYKFSKSHRNIMMLLVTFFEAFYVFITTKKVDILFGRHLLLLLFLKIFFGRSIICEVHAITTSQKWSKIVGMTLKKANGIVVISKVLRDDLIDYYALPIEKFIILPDAADVVEVIETSKKNDRFTIGYVGGFYSGRGIELIINLASKLPDFDFVLIGASTEQLEYYRKQDIHYNLIVMKYQPQSSLKQYYESFDLVVAPYGNSISTHGGTGDTSRWASPLKLFEYMSYKKCMLVSDIPVFKEVLNDQVNCILCKPDDINDWIKQILFVYNDEVLRTKIASNAHDDFANNYTWEKRASRLLKFIEEETMSKY